MDEWVTTVDKFTFRVPADRLFSRDGIWFRAEGTNEPPRWRIGLSDFLQQRSGDLTFALMRPEGTRVAAGEELGVIETIKVNVGVIAPSAGAIVEVNPELEATPELINQDPYEKGWLAVIEVPAGEDLPSRLMAPAAYFEHMKLQAETEVRSR